MWWHRRRRSVSGRSHFHSLGADDAFPLSNGGMWYFCFEPPGGSSLMTRTCHEQLPPLNHPSRNFRHSWILKGLAFLLSGVLQRSREAPLQDPPRQDHATGNTKLSPSLRDDPFPGLPLPNDPWREQTAIESRFQITEILPVSLRPHYGYCHFILTRSGHAVESLISFSDLSTIPNFATCSETRSFTI